MTSNRRAGVVFCLAISLVVILLLSVAFDIKGGHVGRFAESSMKYGWNCRDAGRSEEECLVNFRTLIHSAPIETPRGVTQ